MLAGWSFGLAALWDSISVYIGSSPRERKKWELIDERKQTSKQPPMSGEPKQNQGQGLVDRKLVQVP